MGSEENDKIPEDKNHNKTSEVVPEHYWSKENQPSGNAKSLGWWRKQKGRKMMKALMEMNFVANETDPVTGAKIENRMKREAAAFFQVPEMAITNEMMMTMQQMAIAIKKQDLNTFNSLWEKTYGKPKEDIIDDDGKIPEIKISIVAGASEFVLLEELSGVIDETTYQTLVGSGFKIVRDVPPISESEESNL